MAAFNELLRPERFNAEPSYFQFGKQFKQWFKTLKNFVDSVTSLAQGRNAEPPNKLRSLRAYVSANVYEMIEDCATYDAAIQKLRDIYVKLPNVVFARYLLATRKLKPRETLLDFLHALHTLSKDCNFKNYIKTKCMKKNTAKLVVELVFTAFIL